jgi:co-chaperonin GroES (HSP10)
MSTRQIYIIDQDTVNKFKAVTNYVFIKIDDPNEYRKTKGGIYLYFNPELNRAKDTDRHGIVMSVCKTLFFDKEDYETVEFDVDIDVEVGDRVWFAPMDGANCDTFYCENDKYLLLKYDTLRFVHKKNGEVFGLNGNLLVKPIFEEEKFIIHTIKRENRKKGIVVYPYSNIRDIVSEGNIYPDFNKDEIVLLDRDWDIRLEDQANQYLDEEFRVIRGCDVCAILGVTEATNNKETVQLVTS